MKVAVTGASGFVGSHVLDALAARGDVEIVAASRGPIPPAHLPPAARHVELDIATASETDYRRLGNPDILIHLAWGGLPNYLSLHHFEQELPAHYRFLRAMIGAGLGSLLVTGTCYEYGMLGGELAETDGATPGNPYAFAKAALLRQLEFLRAELAFELTWARLFYMFGPRQAPTSIYPQLAAAAERGDATFPMSQGEQLRDYLPVEDVAANLVALAVRASGAGVVNVCSGRPIAIRALVEQWIEVNDWNIVPELGRYPYPTYEPLAFWGSRLKLDAVLGLPGNPDGG
jgi:nucleoside-diphosphate-sugar epimerase